jgi:hypothetical protein
MNPTTYINPNTMPTILKQSVQSTSVTVHIDAGVAMNTDKLRYCKAQNRLYLVSPVESWPKSIYIVGRQEGATYIMDANNALSSVRRYYLSNEYRTPNAPDEMYVWHYNHADDMMQSWRNAVKHSRQHI